MIVGHPGVLEVWPGSLPGTHRRLSGSGSWKKGRSHPGSWMILALPVGEGTPEGLCEDVDHNRNHTPT